MIPRFTFLVTLLIFINLDVYSQKTFLLRGTVHARGTNSPVPYANIWIVDSTTGTATDSKGEFVLKLEERHMGKKIQVSSIGFKTRLYAADSLTGSDYVNINLETDVGLLDEVVISEAPVNPRQIIEIAIESITENYLNTPFNLEYYSQIVATEHATGKQYELETILFGYSQGYSSHKRRPFEVIEKRTSGEDHLRHLEYDYWPGLEIHVADLISSPYKQGILNLKHLDKFDLKYSNVSLYDEDTVLSIEYSLPKPTKEITGYGIVPETYRGTIFIATGTNAIIKHEITTDQFSYSVIYKKIEGKYFPYLLSGERRPEATAELSKITNTISLRRVETKEIKVIDSKTNEFGDLDSVKFDEAFWNANYPKVTK